MCTHNARGTDLAYGAFPKRGWSGFPLINGCHLLGETPIPAARSSADTAGGPGELPEENLKKKMVASGGRPICSKDIDL